MRPRRAPPPLLALLAALLPLGGCQPFYAASGTFAGLNVVALTTLGRGLPDAVVSFIRDRDCSVVRLEQGQSYCVPPDRVTVPEFCTHSLGIADCWARPALLPGHPVGLADTPAATPEQIARRAHHWPDIDAP
jgi:hypothetical protein